MSPRLARADDEPGTSTSLDTPNRKFRFIFAIIGQGLFSMSRFITTMVIGGRFNMNNVSTGAGSQGELAYYVTYFSVLLFGMGLLEAFVTTPMTYLMHSRRDQDKPQFSTFLLLICIAISGFFLGLLLLAGFVAQFSHPHLGLFTITAFAFLVATQFMRQFLIRWLLAHLKTGHYAAYELTYFLVFVLATGLIIGSQQIFLSTIFLIAGISNLLLIAIVWWRHCSEFSPIYSTLQQTGVLKRWSGVAVGDTQQSQSKLWPEFISTLREQIYFGRWLAADSVFALMTMYFFNWFLLLKIDDSAAGVYGACMQIVLLANPLLNGVMSAFGPIVAIEYQNSGKAGLNRILWQYGSMLVGLMFLFAAFLWFAGGPLTKLVYGASYEQFFAERYSGENRIPFLLGLSMPLNAAAYLLACSLMACGEPKYNCFSSLAGLLVVVGLGAMLREPDLESCALCFSISIGVTLAFRIYFYRTFRGESGNLES